MSTIIIPTILQTVQKLFVKAFWFFIIPFNSSFVFILISANKRPKAEISMKRGEADDESDFYTFLIKAGAFL